MKEAHKMEYNSQRETLAIAEYGRNIQNLLGYVVKLEDEEERQKYANRMVALMLQMNPQSKNLAEYKDKLWRHAFMISDYKLNVKTPSGEVPQETERRLKPQQLTYPKGKSKFRHYGHNVQDMIDKAIAMEDEEKKSAFVTVIASYMKLAYQTWNREHYVNDEIIKKDLHDLSGGKLQVAENVSIDYTKSQSMNRQRRKPSRSNHKGRSNNNNRNRRRR